MDILSNIWSKIENFRRKFWLWAYRESGKRVDIEAEELWDEHYWSVISQRTDELLGMDRGKDIIRMLHFDYYTPDRDLRVAAREQRDRA